MTYSVHSVTTRRLETGRWVAKCACGEESPRSSHKPVVDTWRKEHLKAARTS